MNEFKKYTGASLLKRPASLLLIALITIITAYIVAVQGFIFGVILLLIPFVGYLVVHIAVQPRVGFILLMLAGFFAIGLTRYIQGIPFGLSIDIILILIIVMIFFSGWKKLDWKPARNDLTMVSAIWFAYVLLQLVNPEMVSKQAWFYAMRGIGFYQLLIVIAAFMVFTKYRDLKVFLIIWMVISVLGTLKGIMQLNMGPDAWEQAWLDGGGDVTHIIFGNLRVFSFYSDAGQFGAAQGHAALVAGIIAVGPGSLGKKAFFGIIALITFYGLLISGTRGALTVPGAGIFIYLFLRKNFKVLALGFAFFFIVFAFLKFTTIGQSNYQIRRMRTIFDKEDASYLVRIENQQKIKNYMSSRPFGGGVGTAGNWGQRFSPGTFLAETPTDSWYVRIWAECGIIGLLLHLAILIYILAKCCLIIWFKLKDPEINQIMIALVSGYAGILVASYGNGVLGQMPTGILIYLSWVFIYVSPKLELEKLKIKANKQ